MPATAPDAAGQKPTDHQHGRVVHQTVLVVAARLLGGAGMLALNLIVARYLPPAEYGAFALSVTVLILIDSLIGSAIDLGVLRLATDEPRPAGSSSGFELAGATIKLFIAAAMLLLALAGGKPIVRLLFGEAAGVRLPETLAVAAGALLLFRSLQVHWQIKGEFGKHAGAELIHLTLRIAGLLSLLYLGLRQPWLLMAGYAAASALMVALIAVGPWRPAYHFADFTRRAFLDTVRRGWHAMQVFGIGAVVSRAGYFALAATGQPVELGIYSAAQVLASTPELIASYSSIVLSPRILPAIRDGSFRRLNQRVTIAGGVLALAALAGGLLLAGPLIRWFLPPSYRVAIPIVDTLLPGYLATSLLFPITLSFLVFKRPRIFVFFDSISLPIIAAGSYFGGLWYGAIGVAVLSTVARVIKFAVIQSLAWRLARDLEAGDGSQQAD